MATETLPTSPDVIHEDDVSSKTKYLPLYRVIMWDDDVTTMEFVIRMLIRVFSLEYPAAEQVMYEVHYSGAAVAATMPLERAEFKVEQVHTAAHLEHFPFRCTIEPD